MTSSPTVSQVSDEPKPDRGQGVITSNDFLPVVIAPTFNNAGTLAEVLAKLENLKIAIMVVNDGATDDTESILAKWISDDSSGDPLTGHPLKRVVTHPVNRGKAIALQTGFHAAIDEGFTHAVTIDTDGQLDPAQIPALLKEAKRDPGALILGRREDEVDGCPSSHRLGWWMSALTIRLETGLDVPDSQCGLRVYPLAAVDATPCRSRRYGFESEFITRAVWAGFRLREVPVSCLYLPEDTGVSHFRPWRDGLQGFCMHAYLTLRRLIPWPVARADVRSSDKMHATPAVLNNPFRRISPIGLWDQLRYSRFEQLVTATSFGIGLFMACMPLGGWQWLLGVYAAFQLRIHIIPVVLGTVVFGTTAVLASWSGALARLTMAVGEFFVGWIPIGLVNAETGTTTPWTIQAFLWATHLVGAVVVAFFLHWMTLTIFVLLFRLIPVKHDHDFSR